MPESLPWYLISDDEFEHLVADILRSLEFNDIEVFSGGGDRGRDIIAYKDETGAFPNRTKTYKYVIECKRFIKATVSIEDISRSVNWFVSRDEFQRMIIVCSGAIRTDTRDFLKNMALSYKKDIDYIERNELEEIIENNPKIKNKYFPTENLLHAENENLQEIINTHAELDDTKFVTMIKKDGNINPIYSNIIYMEQNHKITYIEDSDARRELMFRFINISNAKLDSEVFSFFGNSISAKLGNLSIHVIQNGSLVKSKHEFVENTHQSKKICVTFEPLSPYDEIEVHIGFDWPFPLPLLGKRHYAMAIDRPTRKLVFEVVYPSNMEKVNTFINVEKRGTPLIEPLDEPLDISILGNTDNGFIGIVHKILCKRIYRVYFELLAIGE